MLSIITPGNEIDMFLPEDFYSDVYQLVDRCNRMIERNLKEAGTIVDTTFAYDATSRKISVHVGADNVVTLISDLASSMGFSPKELTFREERKYKGMVAMNPSRDSPSARSLVVAPGGMDPRSCVGAVQPGSARRPRLPVVRRAVQRGRAGQRGPPVVRRRGASRPRPAAGSRSSVSAVRRDRDRRPGPRWSVGAVFYGR